MAIQGASLQPIYGRLNAVEEENPGSAVTFADWSMQAGDTVTIVRDGKEYKSTVHTSTMVWKGKTPTVTINNNSSERRGSVALESRKKFGRGGSALRASENAYQSIETSYNNMRSGLVLASSSAALYVDNKYTQMSSGLKLTSSSAALYVDNKYSQMSSGLNLSSSSAALYVDNKYSQMKAGLALTSSSAVMYVRSKTTKAELLLSITNGKSNAKLTADTIDIDGIVNELTSYDVITETFTTTNTATFGGDVECQEGLTVIGDLNAEANVIGADATFDSVTIGNNEVHIYDATIVGNTLKIYCTDGSTVNFSKATWMTGAWNSSGKLTVKAKQNNSGTDTDVATLERTLSSGTRTWDGNTCSVPVRAYYGQTPPTYEDTGLTITVDASARYNAGFDAITGSDITLCGYGTSPQNSKPTFDGTWETLSSGKKRLSAYIWARRTDNKWYRLRSFSFTEP